MNQCLNVSLGALVAQVIVVSSVGAQSAPAVSQAQQVLSTKGAEQKYTFLVFFKDNDAATRSLT